MKNIKFEMFAGIDTMQLYTPDLLEPRNYITNDGTPLTNGWGYRIDPNKTGIEADTVQKYSTALKFVVEDSNVLNGAQYRFDIAIDEYEAEFSDIKKRYKLLMLLIDNVDNPLDMSKQENDMETAGMWNPQKKAMKISGRNYSIMAYDKWKQDGGASGVKGRFELQEKKLYETYKGHRDRLDPDNAQMLVDEVVDKWIDRIRKATTGENFDSVVNRLNDNLCAYYSTERQARRIAEGMGHLIDRCADYIFTTPQLKDLLERHDIKNAGVRATQYKDSYELECFSLREIRDLGKSMIAALKEFKKNRPAEVTAGEVKKIA